MLGTSFKDNAARCLLEHKPGGYRFGAPMTLELISSWRDAISDLEDEG